MRSSRSRINTASYVFQHRHNSRYSSQPATLLDHSKPYRPVWSACGLTPLSNSPARRARSLHQLDRLLFNLLSGLRRPLESGRVIPILVRLISRAATSKVAGTVPRLRLYSGIGETEVANSGFDERSDRGGRSLSFRH
jgi:hypothetical protein